MGFDKIVSSQPQLYSALWRVIETEVDPVCRANGIGQLVWSPLAQGVLTGKYTADSAPRPTRAPPPNKGQPSSAAGCGPRC